MKKYIEQLEKDFSPIQSGFKEEERRALQDYQNYKQEEVEQLAHLAYQSEVYQVRMYGVFLFGYLSQKEEILVFMREEVSKDDNWRVGYAKALPVIDEWLTHPYPNTRRAVTEGLRIWTSRPYFKEHPHEAIRRIAALKEDESEYVRKSVGNALRDISKKYPAFIKAELGTWTLDSKVVQQVYKLASKFI